MTDLNLTQADVKRATYELFVLGLSGLAVINAVAIELGLVNDINVEILKVINTVLALFFLVDFLLRFFRADSKSEYFFRKFGWADLLSGIPLPAFQVFRFFRMAQSLRTLRRLGGRKVLREVNQNRAGGALNLALFLAVILVQGASTTIINIEADNPAANIVDASDAVWWAYVTITTVGYGDYYPVTNSGRILGVVVMTIGVGLFGVLSGFLANLFLGGSRDSEEEEDQDTASGTASPQLQSADLRALLAEQEKNFAELRRRLEAMDAELQKAGIVVDVPAMSPSDAAPPG